MSEVRSSAERRVPQSGHAGRGRADTAARPLCPLPAPATRADSYPATFRARVILGRWAARAHPTTRLAPRPAPPRTFIPETFQPFLRNTGF